MADGKVGPDAQDVRCNPRSSDMSALDAGVRHYVEVLIEGGIETFESCQGGDGHAFAEPTVRFYGGRPEGYRALAVALERGLPVAELQRVWPVVQGEATGPWWQLTFIHQGPVEAT